MKTRTRKLTAAERMAFGAGETSLYNRVRSAGRAMGLGLGEGLIGTVALAIAQARCDGVHADARTVVDYSRVCGVSDCGTWRPLTTAEAEMLLATQ